MLERRRWNMVALAGDYHANASGERGNIGVAAPGQQRDDAGVLPGPEPRAAALTGRRGGRQ